MRMDIVMIFMSQSIFFLEKGILARKKERRETTGGAI
jgi:hypothetical protein